MLRVQCRLLGRQLLPAQFLPLSRFASSSRQSVALAPPARLGWSSSRAQASYASSWSAPARRNSPFDSSSSPLSSTCRRLGLSSYSKAQPAAWNVVPRSVSSQRYGTVVVEKGSGGGSGNAGGGAGGGGGGSGDGAGGAGGGARGDGKRSLWAWYLAKLDSDPIFTKAVTAGILTFIGDIVCQFAMEKTDEFDLKRISIMTFLGFALVGPTLHYWYSALTKLVTVGGPAGVTMRLILDQFVFTPTFIAIFLATLLTLEGKSKQISAKLKQDWPSTVVANWYLWVPAQIINFTMVPLKLRVAFANFIGLFWNAYLSHKSHIQVADPQPSEVKP